MCIRDSLHLNNELKVHCKIVFEAYEHIREAQYLLPNPVFRLPGLPPVSYTHLDVYKRQMICCLVCFTIPGPKDGSLNSAVSV